MPKRSGHCVEEGRKRRRQWTYGRASKTAVSLAHLKGGSGFLLTTDQGCERKAAHEFVDLFAEYVDRIYPRCEPGAVAKCENGRSLDAGSLVAAELMELKSAQARLQIFDIGSKGLAFVRVVDPDDAIDTVELLAAVVGEIATGSERQLRHCIRVMPLQRICNASVEDIIETCTPMLHGTSKDESFAINVKRRSCSLDRSMVIDSVAALMPKEQKVNLKSPDLLIMVECLRSMVGISVVRRIERMSNFNVRAAAAKGQSNAAHAEIPRI